MSRCKVVKNLSISSCATLSILPSGDHTSQTLNSPELFQSFSENPLPPTHDCPDFEKYLEEPSETLRLYTSIDEEAPTIRAESSIFCMNCCESIENTLVDQHSLVCFEPIKSSLKIEEKISGLLEWVRYLKTDCKELYLYPLILLEDICKEILYKTQSDLIISLERTSLVFRDFKDYPVILLTAQRLAFLIETLINKPRSSAALKISRIGVTESCLNTSKICSSCSCFSDFTELPSVERLGHEATLEKLFYSQCIKLKRSLSTQKTVPFFLLFQQCQEENIPIDQWREFITESLS